MYIDLALSRGPCLFCSLVTRDKAILTTQLNKKKYNLQESKTILLHI